MKRLFMLTIAAVSLFWATGCSDDDKDNDDGLALGDVPAAVQASFNARYAGATHVRWSAQAGYMVASFQYGGAPMLAWFLSNGGWRMTEEDIRYDELPAAVRAAFEAGEYARWRIEDVERLYREGLEMVYVIEVEQGNIEHELFYSEDGILLTDRGDTDDTDDDYPDHGDGSHGGWLPADIPQAALDFLNRRYPGHRIVDTDRERGMYEVEIIDARTQRDVFFTLEGSWVETRTEISRRDTPEAVLNTVAAEYAGWKVEDIEHVESATDGEWYEVEIEEPRSDREMTLRVRPDGTLLR